VCVYVIDRDSVLVFEHQDLQAGVQVPAGGIAPGESVRVAAEREVLEETGLAVRFTRLLGYEDTPHPQTGEPRRTAYVTASPLLDRPIDSWEHEVESQDGDTDLVFVCRFTSLHSDDLVYDQRTYLSALAEQSVE
jgi:8-oxo-dGTP pyrophosphatase MutT (NUDIX family)